LDDKNKKNEMSISKALVKEKKHAKFELGN
jgi:hypothetical protein